MWDSGRSRTSSFLVTTSRELQLEMAGKEPGPWPTNGWLVPLKHDPEKVLAAPVMEICIAFDIQPGYTDAVGKFVGYVDKDWPEGYHGAAYGECASLLSDQDGIAPSRAANLILGWDSKQAHEDAKARPGNGTSKSSLIA